MSNKIPENLKYTQDHDWISIDGNIITLGITDFAQAALGDIVFIELPEVGRSLARGDTFGVVESVKTVADIHAPMSGKIIEVNNDLDGQPDLCNKNPYGTWLVKIQVASTNDLKNLMDANKYTEFCANAH
ncbi:MAG: glycine cleavage system protein H [Bdellovibrionales bacterium RIFOXYD12_FULL_39_22]|nr:MAG: glycine cleavage system protein H [Bdellovibrionales bacterium RIFOXYB1_FULL_39_21]OFZ41937.1 MAG: glycine cleavage system protein H [Bdellovibrionales bacterium RIFOXYC12_FULL_39_17]OFZ50653.1 MAG: glycine cleavage system protein H [Bdellovibrionales bacterium RIFOXYC1_FULL_39_130]OFZ77876.1 MAG: glycine cleavage system protein H [Bdellovibrionales bacterium RIFOXYD1_FULL_39_84]OFZ93688.1 MAG: glycine cleavage system protein H [Bdellovibrionales bacterium RIFOXYD12_FULL_39_22]HLE10176